MKSQASFRKKPGAFQQGTVFALCILLLIGMAYVGAHWLVGDSALENTLKWIDELKSRQ